MEPYSSLQELHHGQKSETEEILTGQHSSLGKFTFLPLELRDQIWNTAPLESRFSLLRVSRQIYAELSPRLYKDVALQFTIHPKYQYQSWIRVESSSAAQWLLHNVDDATKRGFDRIPFYQLKKIRIIIEAPDKKDQGQIICLYKKCLDLAGLLENAIHGLPNVEIVLSKSASSSWTVRGEPQRSIDLDQATFSDDHLIVLQAFSRVRNARSATISLPVKSEEGNYLIENFADAWMREIPFGQNLDLNDPWNDQELQEEMDNIFVDLDMELDLLSGHTADLMRLDRFASWYSDKIDGESKYESEYERIIRAWKGFQDSHDSTAEISEQSKLLKSLLWRYGAMRAFDPAVSRRPDAQKRYPCCDEHMNGPAGIINEWDWDRCQLWKVWDTLF
ncbi:MAG: hypothetical protein Q9184_002896 [Pyrenodesmia sp. 2 TL-2023]